MIRAADIPEYLEVVSSDGQHVGRVEHARGDRITLARLDRTTLGAHYSIPISWVDRVEDKVHLNVTSEQAAEGLREEPSD